MKTILVIDTLKAAAREDQKRQPSFTATGAAQLGPVACSFYPRCNRHTFWLRGSVISLRDLRTWLRQDGWR